MSKQENVVDPCARRCISLMVLLKMSGHIALKSVDIWAPSLKNHSSPTFVPWIHTSILEPFAIGTKDRKHICFTTSLVHCKCQYLIYVEYFFLHFWCKRRLYCFFVQDAISYPSVMNN